MRSFALCFESRSIRGETPARTAPCWHPTPASTCNKTTAAHPGQKRNLSVTLFLIIFLNFSGCSVVVSFGDEVFGEGGGLAEGMAGGGRDAGSWIRLSVMKWG